MKNWWSISLINADTKVASKALAARTKNVLTSIVHCNQTAYVKDRHIGESIRSDNRLTSVHGREQYWRNYGFCRF